MTTNPPTIASRERGGNIWRRRGVLLLSLLVPAALVSGLLSGESLGVERRFAGSAQLDYLAVPTADNARRITLDGFTTELSMKLAVDYSDDVSVHVKMCYGCHGFELGMGYADLRVTDALNFRVGRFTPSFGDFPVRHDPANHRTSDKPLPYDMGRMVRLREWNMSILPAPYVDNGLELFGTIALGEDVDVDYAAYVIGGLRGSADATDVDFIQSRSPAFYYVDNNSQPSVGGRLAMGFQLGESSSLTLGSSALYGTYDPNNVLDYLVLGADAVLKIDRWTLRVEYLLRRTQMAMGDDPATRFRYGPGDDGNFDDFFLKDGFYVETDVPLTKKLEMVVRVDGMRRLGNVVNNSALRSESAVLRYTAGLNVRFLRQLRVKFSTEWYDFSDFDDELGVHLGFTGAF